MGKYSRVRQQHSNEQKDATKREREERDITSEGKRESERDR